MPPAARNAISRAASAHGAKVHVATVDAEVARDPLRMRWVLATAKPDSFDPYGAVLHAAAPPAVPAPPVAPVAYGRLLAAVKAAAPPRLPAAELSDTAAAAAAAGAPLGASFAALLVLDVSGDAVSQVERALRVAGGKQLVAVAGGPVTAAARAAIDGVAASFGAAVHVASVDVGICADPKRMRWILATAKPAGAAPYGVLLHAPPPAAGAAAAGAAAGVCTLPVPAQAQAPSPSDVVAHMQRLVQGVASRVFSSGYCHPNTWSGVVCMSCSAFIRKSLAYSCPVHITPSVPHIINL